MVRTVRITTTQCGTKQILNTEARSRVLTRYFKLLISFVVKACLNQHT